MHLPRSPRQVCSPRAACVAAIVGIGVLVWACPMAVGEESMVVYSNITTRGNLMTLAHSSRLWDDLHIEWGGTLDEVTFSVFNISPNPQVGASGTIEFRVFDNPNGGPIGTLLGVVAFSFPGQTFPAEDTILVTKSGLAGSGIDLPVNEVIAVGIQFNEWPFGVRTYDPPTVGSSEDVYWRGDDPTPLDAGSQVANWAWELRAVGPPQPPSGTVYANLTTSDLMAVNAQVWRIWDDLLIVGGGRLDEITFSIHNFSADPRETATGDIEFRLFDNPNGGPVGTLLGTVPLSVTDTFPPGQTTIATQTDLADLMIELPVDSWIAVGIRFDQTNLAVQTYDPPILGTSEDRYWSGDDPTPQTLSGAVANFAYQVRVTSWPIGGVFVPLDDPDAGVSRTSVAGVSSDGSVVVGAAFVTSEEGMVYRPMRWTAETGVRALEGFPEDARWGYAVAASADGAVIGGSLTYPSGEGQKAFRWTEVGGFDVLGDLPGGTVFAEVEAASADGSILVGVSSSDLGYEGFRWTAASGMVPLSDLPGTPALQTAAWDISADGDVIVGVVLHDANTSRAFYWTDAGGMVQIDDLAGGEEMGSAYGVSPDGTIIVGQGGSEQGREAIRWENGHMLALGGLPGGDVNSLAYALSADGSLIAGRGKTGDFSEAFLWTADGGMRNLREMLIEDYELNLDGWLLSSATGVSDDGRIIVGPGVNPDGSPDGWVVTLPEGPMPGDVDGDGDVDLDDHSLFIPCMTGPGIAATQDCEGADADNDGDADLVDFSLGQAGFATR